MSKVFEQAVIAALTEENITRITGLSQGQLRAWDKRGFFVPRHAHDDRSSAYSRIHSFKDAVGLKTIALLRNAPHKLSLNRLVKVAEELSLRGFQHWADTKLYVVKKEVYFQHPETDKVESLKTGQFAILEVINVLNDVQDNVIQLKKRDETQIGRVQRNRFVAHNTWVISGTRIPTSTIRRYLDAGFDENHVLKEYPTLTLEDIRGAMQHEVALKKAS